MDVIIWGAKGHARVLAELFAQTGRRVVALFDNDPTISSPLAGVPLAIGWDGFCDWLKNRDPAQFSFAVAIGGDRGPQRLSIAIRLQEFGLSLAETIHPSAYVSPTACIHPSSHILARSTVGVDVTIAQHCIINTGAIVDHECHLGTGVHLAPGATLAGCVTIGDHAFIGTNATILPNLTIGENATVGAGAVVTSEVPANSIAYGVPARVHGIKPLVVRK
jgi:sugar O-acyltransferase (sialic acid O-acetyltransferase NeuD family)